MICILLKRKREKERILFEFTENFYDEPAGELLKKGERRAFNLRS